MTRDYKNVTERGTRSKSKVKKNSSKKPKLSRRFLLFSGLVIVSFVLFLVYLTLEVEVEHEAADVNKARVIAEPNVREVKPEESVAEEKSRFDFYSILPERKIEAPVEEIIHEEQAVERGAPLVPQASRETLVDEPKNRASRLYILQAGSFSQFKDADKRKANLAFLGVASKIHAISNNNRAMYRVQVGPFSDIKKVNDIASLLKRNKIPSLLMKKKDR